MARKAPVQASPVQRVLAGKPNSGMGVNPSIINFSGLPFQAEHDGAAPSMLDYLGLPFAADTSVGPSFIFPPLPFADDNAE